MHAEKPPSRQVRAVHDDTTIVVYQAYPPGIAEPALAAGRFVPPFSMTRMTWVKPSFLWMMYRCGWGTKPGQERVLAIRITRAGFEEALAGSCLSHYDPGVHGTREEWRHRTSTSSVRVQWDPERGIALQRLDHRSLQVGLTGPAVREYVDRWTVGIEDVTPLAAAVHAAVREGRLDAAAAMLPDEQPYVLSPDARAATGAST
jgi:hypothetical protein